MKVIVGIDFGTSTTVVRYREEGTDVIHSLKAENGKSEIIPSVIFRQKENGIAVYGEEAIRKEDAGIDGEFITNFKMDLLNPDKKEEAKKNIIEFLTFIHSLFEEQTKAMHPDTMDVYISYPAKWSDDMVTFMKQAVEAAGFKGNGITVKGMKEPQAASLNMLHEYQDQLKKNKLLAVGKPLRVLMLDMGAGTSDISIFKLEIDRNGGTKISELLSYPSISEPILCGGREIDAAFQKYFIDMCKEKGQPLMPECVSFLNIKTWKENTLSKDLKSVGIATTMPSNIAMLLKAFGRTNIINCFKMDHNKFESYTNDHWEKLYKLICSAFAQYRFAKPEDIDVVFLTGGHCNWYLLPDLFNGKGLTNGLGKSGKKSKALYFKKIVEEPALRMTDLNSTLPHECVARGLCLADERVEIKAYPTNNVWAKIKVCDVEGELTQVVSKNDILPQQHHIEFKNQISKNCIFDKLKCSANIEIYTGEKVKDAEKRQWSFTFDEDNALGKVIVALLIIPIFLNAEWDVFLSMDITMTDEGQLKVDGTFKLDDKEIKFTEKELKMV